MKALVDSAGSALALEWLGTSTGIVGAILVSQGRPAMAVAGFVIWIVSNISWILFARLRRQHGLLVMQGFYLCTSLVAVVNWLDV